MTKKITITNDFHHSSITVRVPSNGLLSVGTTKRIYRTLCGIADCQCGGIRGKQATELDRYSHQDQIAVG